MKKVACKVSQYFATLRRFDFGMKIEYIRVCMLLFEKYDNSQQVAAGGSNLELITPKVSVLSTKLPQKRIVVAEVCGETYSKKGPRFDPWQHLVVTVTFKLIGSIFPVFRMRC